MNENSKGWVFWIVCAALLALAFALTQIIKNEYFYFASYTVLMAIVMATAWNILGGYAGYVNFGAAAFFGMGTYIAVLMFKSMGAPLGVQILASSVVGGLIGLGTGLLTLRLRGIFFSIATVALTIILETVIINWRYVGGATGIQLERPPVIWPFDAYIKMLFVVAVFLVLLSLAIARYIESSWIGRGLRAIRDNELAAECSGVPTLKLKLMGCALSGALMSAAGAPSAMYLSYAEPASAFNMNLSVAALAMPIIGGTANWIGPVLGGLLLGITQQYVTVTISSELNVLVVGVLLVLFVVLAPDGIVGLYRKIRRRK
jgi:branched-chain amino acid transport system permease protein